MPQTTKTHLAIPLVLLSVVGCTGGGTSGAGTDTDAGSSSSGAAASSDGVGDESTTTGTPDASTSSSGSNDTSTGDPDDDGDPDTSSGGDPDPIGVCVGYDFVGDLARVFETTGSKLPAPACSDEPAACAGDVVGSWSVAASCGYDSIANPAAQDCPDSAFVVEVVAESGTLDFVDDGTFTWTSSVDLLSTLTFDAQACFGSSCQEAGAALMKDDPDVVCTEVETLCSCAFPTTEPADIAGTWSTDEGVLELDVDGDTAEYEFCVAGDRLDLWEPLIGFTVTEELCDLDGECSVALGDAHEGYVCVPPDEE
ncbi:MAG: hypothetical protein AAF721_05275 [Myxococcota bacterium]